MPPQVAQGSTSGRGHKRHRSIEDTVLDREELQQLNARLVTTKNLLGTLAEDQAAVMKAELESTIERLTLFLSKAKKLVSFVILTWCHALG